MPEGHSVHRIARQFALHFVGKRIAASSPQGRFADGAAEIDGRVMTAARAVGKQMFLEFEGDRFLRVHLGLYGAWDFAGDITADATTAASRGRMGQTNQRGTVAGTPDAAPGEAAASITDSAGEDSLSSIGAPRVARLRMAEQESLGAVDSFPPEPVGQVRVRLLADDVVADLRGPTACEVLNPEQVQVSLDKLGPDPLVDPGKKSEDRFTATVRSKATPIGLLLMDQSVVSGIGNVYRAELLFRARLNPHTRGKDVPEETVRALWKDWTKLLRIGVELGQMMTMDRLGKVKYAAALARRDSRHWVYHREGKPCRVCGTPIVMEMAAGRKLYWCPKDQA
ncbi:MAG: Fpg/Nei family DNA glycosylase [Burkholderiaceae bacterium]|nr:Fpg/Nei family DNA glycosylase [Microbacteriaceae bacterium]